MEMEAAEPAAVSPEVCNPLAKKAKALDRARAHISATKALSMKGPPTGELHEGDRLLLRLPRRWQVLELTFKSPEPLNADPQLNNIDAHICKASQGIPVRGICIHIQQAQKL